MSDSPNQHPAQRGRAPANPPSRRSLSTNIAEGNSSATAKAGINGVVPRPSDEHSVIQKLKEALRMQPDQTTVLTLDGVDLDSLPEVERFLENSRVRVDYNSSTHSIVITMASDTHEYAARTLRKIFEPVMESLQSRYGGFWKYDTNCLTCIYHETHGNGVLPTKLWVTPDGAISDDSGILLAVEISNSQSRNEVRRKMKTFFNDPSVIAGIILNIDETPPYALPDKANDWDSAESFVEGSRWDDIVFDAWGPITFAGHCWGGVFSCQIEIHWPSVDGDQTITASLVPSSSREELADLNEELTEVWKALVKTHYNHPIDTDEYHTVLDIDSFRLDLWKNIRRSAHKRYARVWSRDNNNTIAPIQLDREARRVRRDAAEHRIAARLQKRRRIDRGEEEDREGLPF